MLHFLPHGLRGTLAVLLILANTLLLYPPLLLLSVIKMIPVTALRTLCTRLLNRVAVAWINNNGRTMRLLHRLDWQVEGLESLEQNQWYFVTCNHQSWADIMVTQNVLNNRIPLMKFFLKKELIWVPLLGIAWWALDFPFMKRYSKELLAKKPHLQGKDLETTRKACEKFKYTPVTVFNFLEGTRFTPEKHQAQNSPYTHLLRPKAGGAGFVLGAMGEQLHTMLDITIVYPDGAGGIWDYLAGRMQRIVVTIKRREIPAQFLGRDYVNDPEFRNQFQNWVSDIWQQKDQHITELMKIHSKP
ncbi:MAG: acyltransferase [Halomonadaceae bacterium]|nr:MAG: acyltransferase [Halomonadaceae bacterium]